MSSPGFERHPLYYKTLGYGLYGVAGFLLVTNARCTAIAYRDGVVPLAIAWLLAIAFSVVSIGTGAFLTSPQTWGPLWFSFCATAANAGKWGDRSAPRAVMAPLLSTMAVAMVAFWVLIQFLDWTSTWQYFDNLGVRDWYLLSTTALLVIGPEFCFIIAHAILKQHRPASIRLLQEAITNDPQEVYLKEVYKGRVDVARQAGQADASQNQYPNY